MTDCELLELAAKAARYKVVWIDKHDVGLTDEYIVPLPKAAQHFVFAKHPYNRWDPLDDDGDALRLAVKLDLTFQALAENTTIEVWHHGSLVWEPWGLDKFAATRRAIVRAAAAIGAHHGA